MKTKKSKRSNFIQLIVLCLLGVSVVLTLILPDMRAILAPAKGQEISVLLRETDVELWSNARLGMEQAAADMGIHLRFLTPTKDNSHDAQAELLLREVNGGADAIVIMPASPVDMDAFCKVQKIDIPIVTLESTMERARVTVAVDDTALGTALGEACLADEPTGTILLLNTAGDSTGIRERLDACTTTLTNAGAEVVERVVDGASLRSDFQLLLAETGATTVIAFEQTITEIIAAQSQILTTPPTLYGVGSTATIAAYLERGTLSAVLAWNDYAAGYLAVQAAGKSISEGIISAPDALEFTTVREENLYEPDHQKLLFPVIY